MDVFLPPSPPRRSPAASVCVTGAGACPHGDEFCPCPGGNLCHYEGRLPMQCPTTLVVGCRSCR